MTTHDQHVPWCEDLHDDLAELALGSLTGRERAVVLAHLEVCPACSSDVEAMSDAADQLVAIAPEIEPPVGFESRLFAQLGRPTPRRQRWFEARARRIAVGAAALVAAVGVGVGVGVGLAAAPSAPPLSAAAAAHPVSAALVSDGSAHGQVVAWGRWMTMVVADAPPTGVVTCQVTTASGRTLDVGSFWLSAGYGEWSVRLPVPAATLTGARVVKSDGTVVAGATFRT